MSNKDEFGCDTPQCAGRLLYPLLMPVLPQPGHPLSGSWRTCTKCFNVRYYVNARRGRAPRVVGVQDSGAPTERELALLRRVPADSFEDIEPGDIWAGSGYEATSTHFFMVLRATSKTVWLSRIPQLIVAGSGNGGLVVPYLIDPDPNSIAYMKRLHRFSDGRRYAGNLSNVRTAMPWAGRPTSFDANWH